MNAALCSKCESSSRHQGNRGLIMTSQLTVPPLPASPLLFLFGVWCMWAQTLKLPPCHLCLNRRLQMGVDGGAIVSLWRVCRRGVVMNVWAAVIKLQFSHAESPARGFARLAGQEGRVQAARPDLYLLHWAVWIGRQGGVGVKVCCITTECVTHLRMEAL